MTSTPRAIPGQRRFPPPVSIPQLVILLLVFVGMALIGNYVFRRVVGDGSQQTTAYQTAPVTRRTIESTVSGTGSVASTQQVRVTFESTGQVQDVLVKQGDHVEAGQPLASLNPFPLQIKRDTAQTNLSTAQYRLDALLAGPTSADVASAQQAVVSAQSTLTTAQNTLANLLAGSTADDIAQARTALERAQANLTAAQQAWDRLASGTDLNLRPEYTALQTARANLQTAQSNYDTKIAPPNAQDVSSAQATVTSAQAALDSARAKLAEVLAGPDPLDVQNARNQVTSSEAALAAAEAKLNDVKNPVQTTINIPALEAALTAAKANLQAVESAQVDSLERAGATGRLQADANLASARAAVEKAQADLSNALTATSPNSADVLAAEQGVATAKTALETAKNALQKLQQGPAAADVAAAQQAVTAAESQLQTGRNNLDKILAGSTPEDIASARAALDNARSALDVAQINWDRLSQGVDLQSRTEYTTLMSARADYQAALTTYNTKIEGPKPGDVAAAQATVESATASVASAQARLSQVIAGSTDTDIGQAQQAVKSAQLALTQAQHDLDSATVHAPISGTIVSVGINPGDQASATTTAFTLLDPSMVRIDATVDESNVIRLRQGMPVNVSFDALQGRAFQGTVASITPSGVSQQGVVTFPVTVVFNAQGMTIPPGTTATLSFVTESHENALVVPSRAIQRQGQNSFVQVLVDGKPEQKPVRVGITGGSNVEILDGLSEGETVVLPTAQGGAGGQGTFGTGGLPALGGGGAPGGGPVVVPAPAGGR
jgi:HlyD family secretion protein